MRRGAYYRPHFVDTIAICNCELFENQADGEAHVIDASAAVGVKLWPVAQEDRVVVDLEEAEGDAFVYPHVESAAEGEREIRDADGDVDGRAELSMPKGGDAGKLCHSFKSEQNVAEGERILRAPNPDAYVFAYERHEDLARALGIPTFSVGCGYNYIYQDELPGGLEFDDLKHTGEGQPDA